MPAANDCRSNRSARSCQEGTMDFLSRLNVTNALADARLGANLIAIHGVIAVTVIAALFIRRLIIRGGNRLSRWTGLRWLEVAGDEAIRRLRTLLSRLTVL